MIGNEDRAENPGFFPVHSLGALLGQRYGIFSALGMDENLAFTDYVRASAELGAPADGPVLEGLLSRLRATLRKELVARGLWSSSPGRLGIHGYESWSGDRARAVDELVSDCLCEAILYRLPTFEPFLKIQENVEGLVLRAVRNFLYDRQRGNDPLGGRAFEFVRDVVRQAIETGRLELVEGGPGIHNSVRLGFKGASRVRLEPDAEVDQKVATWVRHVAVPDFLRKLSRGHKGQRKLVSQAVEQLAELEGEIGAASFLFKTLVDPWKYELRGYWLSTLTLDLPASDTASAADRSKGSSFEDRQAYLALKRCVEAGIDTSNEVEEVKDRLHLLFETFETLSAESQGTISPREVGDRNLERLLDIPRRHIRTLRRALKDLVRSCGGHGS